MHLAPHMCKTVTVKANAKEISLENAFDTTYVQNRYVEGKC